MSFLNRLGLLSDLTEKEKEDLSLFCQEKVLKAWDILFREWEEWEAMYFLLSWVIEVSKNINWEKRIIWKVLAEEVLWEMALFWRKRIRMATAEVIEDCKLITILSFSVKELTRKHPQLLEKIKEIIDKRIICNKKTIDNVK